MVNSTKARNEVYDPKAILKNTHASMFSNQQSVTPSLNASNQWNYNNTTVNTAKNNDILSNRSVFFK